MAFKPNLFEIMRTVARIVGTRLALQAPVRTGKLLRSIRVEPKTNSIEIYYEDYGTYTNYGTGAYYPGKFKYGTNPDPGSYKSYRKGKKGIRPQYWTAMSSSDETRIETMIADEVEKQTVIYLEAELD
jgi:hypothetical protein